VVVVVTALTIFFLGFRAGRVSDVAWFEFTSPDGSCAIEIHGVPGEEDVEANSGSSVTGGKRYITRGWYSGVTIWLAWGDLDPSLVQSLPKDQDRVFGSTALGVERDREKVRLEGTITKEVIVRFNAAWGIEVHMDTPRGKVIERLLLVTDGAHPRLYIIGIESKNITPESPAARRVFHSFKVNN
jgi:hypothetical protein